MNESYIQSEAIIRDRKPCALSGITSKEGTRVGSAEFYATPIGTVIKAVVFSLPPSSDSYEEIFPEIDGGRGACDTSASYRAKTANLPPIFIKKGKGSFSYATCRFSVEDLIGRRFLLKKGNIPVAEGRINRAFEI